MSLRHCLWLVFYCGCKYDMDYMDMEELSGGHLDGELVVVHEDAGVVDGVVLLLVADARRFEHNPRS